MGGQKERVRRRRQRMYIILRNLPNNLTLSLCSDLHSTVYLFALALLQFIYVPFPYLHQFWSPDLLLPNARYHFFTTAFALFRFFFVASAVTGTELGPFLTTEPTEDASLVDPSSSVIFLDLRFDLVALEAVSVSSLSPSSTSSRCLLLLEAEAIYDIKRRHT